MNLTNRHGPGGRLALALGASALAMMLAVPAASAAAPKTTVASKTPANAQTSAGAVIGDVSGTGRFVAFEDSFDGGVYIRDLVSGKTRIVSVSSTEQSANGNSFDPVVSETGRFVAFTSVASNLIDGKVIDFKQTYLRDRRTGKTELISVNNAGVAANDHADDPHMSTSGRYVVFESNATNLTNKNVNGTRQIYLRDRKLGKTFLISRNNGGRAGNGYSDDAAVAQGGRFVVYTSEAQNLVRANNKGNSQIYRFDRSRSKTTLVSRNRRGRAGNEDSNDAELSNRAAVIVYESDATNLAPGDTNGTDDIYMLKGGRTSRVSRNWKGRQLDGVDGAEESDISLDGRWLTFETDATNATKAGWSGAHDLVYRRDLKTGRVTLVSRTGSAIANGWSGAPQVSDNGRFIIFQTEATNLIAGGDTNGSDADVLRRGAY